MQRERRLQRQRRRRPEGGAVHLSDPGGVRFTLRRAGKLQVRVRLGSHQRAALDPSCRAGCAGSLFGEAGSVGRSGRRNAAASGGGVCAPVGGQLARGGADLRVQPRPETGFPAERSCRGGLLARAGHFGPVEVCHRRVDGQSGDPDRPRCAVKGFGSLLRLGTALQRGVRGSGRR